MDTGIEKRISNIIETQFPSFYRDDGPLFVAFVKAYYAWMEEESNSLNKSRNILTYRNIDLTLESFLESFQKKYLYGIPFDVIINKRLLLKHVLDAYRSKGSLQCFKLLFRLIYNQDMDVYLPGVDMIKPSDGTFKQIRYLEVTTTSGLADLVGKKIVGSTSGTTAIVESYITEPVNNNIIATLYITNILPKGGDFVKGEKIYDFAYKGTTSQASKIAAGSIIYGSLNNIEILSPGQGFSIGDIVKIAKRDPSNNAIIAGGINGQLLVTGTQTSSGTVSFNILEDGFGYTNNALTFLYNNVLDTTGVGAGFSIRQISNQRNIVYCTDLVSTFLDLTLDAATWPFSANASANASSNLAATLTYANNIFGSILSLKDIRPGEDYLASPINFVREPVLSANMAGTVSYTTSSNVVTGTSTAFDDFFANNDTIWLQANISLANTIEYQIIAEVTNSTSMILYSNADYSSTASAIYKVAPEVLNANYPPGDAIFEDFAPLEANISSEAVIGNGAVATLAAIDSGKGYLEGEVVSMYLFGSIDDPTIVDGGLNYSNGESLTIYGGAPEIYATGTVTTDANGTITDTIITNYGSVYKSAPTIIVASANGSGAVLTTTVVNLNESKLITGKVVKAGAGKKPGFFTSTRGFLNSDKYITDSYYYQDFSYEIQTASTLNDYSNILYDTFHIAGAELFGKFSFIEINNEAMSELYTNSAANTTMYFYYNSDMSTITSDANTVTSDTVYV